MGCTNIACCAAPKRSSVGLRRLIRVSGHSFSNVEFPAGSHGSQRQAGFAVIGFGSYCVGWLR
jgi:hypothetical protein